MQRKYLKKLFKKDKHYPVFLVLDVGTTGVKAFAFNSNLKLQAKVYKKIVKKRPKKGWVEQSPEELVSSSCSVLQQAVGAGRGQPIALGITNQRETVIAWDKKTGQPLYPAIVWEDERTKYYCEKLKKQAGKIVRIKTGLFLSSYFSAPKIAWILENVENVQKALKEERLLFGTVDSWILWNLSKRKVHYTDTTNASRTLLFNLHTLAWDNELLDLFDLPANILPKVKYSSEFSVALDKKVIGMSVPVKVMCGDQQASLYAAGNKKGTTKITYGTGTFIMQVIGKKPKLYNPFFTTISPGKKGIVYALEAKTKTGGKDIEPILKNPRLLRGKLTKIAKEADVYLKKLPIVPEEVVVDGGVVRDDILIGLQQKLSGIEVRKQKIIDGTALGVAKLLSAGEICGGDGGIENRVGIGYCKLV